ncbi:glycoside hydrolase family 16 protein [Pluteus cervinus]|uniref:Glycoside hydrolase family 16 protein n=1 Tax=Pluteus cervinus TaxID=181527 RepID=A0ACD3B729_9AGAR|nr:glycoside hydrolase family 16 protein [Pluteus cervinus]
MSTAPRAPEKYNPPPPAPTTTTIPQYIWDKDPDVDDSLHNPDPRRDARLDRSCDPLSFRGWMNAGMIFVIVVGLLTLFAGYPIIVELTKQPPPIIGWNIGGINGSGQIPDLPNIPVLIDADTPSSAYSRTGTDGQKYDLVFSDEFNLDGRTFYPGEDPFWEAVDLHYWPTGDLEWYDPGAVTTANGKLVITLTEQTNHELNFRSGMVTSWNKICFNTGYVEVSVSMPGSPSAPGLWPGVWSLGNLGRAGYGSTTEGMWPYSYDSCDPGTFPNQTTPDGIPPEALTGSTDGGPLSYLPGQRLSACTCPGSDHPGPSVNVGRGVPEIDVLETQVNVTDLQGQVSQSLQVAPYNYKYQIDTSGTNVNNPDITSINTYTGGRFQQAVSAVTYIDSQFYNDNAYAPYGYEWWSNPSRREEGYITWFSNNEPTWTVHASAIGADTVSKVSDRLIPEEPMYLIFNLGLSPSFQKQDWKHLQFPSKMYIDYVRIYQKEGIRDGLTCDPSSRPTSDYISKHMNAYTNPNLTTWSQAGNTFPRNSELHGC